MEVRNAEQDISALIEGSEHIGSMSSDKHGDRTQAFVEGLAATIDPASGESSLSLSRPRDPTPSVA